MVVRADTLPDEILGAMRGISAEDQEVLKGAITDYIAGQKGAKEALLATPPTKSALDLEKEELKAGMQKFESHKSPMGLDADSKFIDLFQQAMKTMQEVGSKPMEFVQSFTGLLQLEGQLANFLSAIAEGTFADEDVRKMVANGLKSYITAYIGKMILDKEGNLLEEVAKNDMPGNATAILQKVRDQIATARTAPTLTPKTAPAEAGQHSAEAAAHFAAAVHASNPAHKENHPDHETHVAAAGKHFEISKAHAENSLNAVSPEHAKKLSDAAASSAEAAGHSAAAANAEDARPHVELANQAAAAAEAHAAATKVPDGAVNAPEAANTAPETKAPEPVTFQGTSAPSNYLAPINTDQVKAGISSAASNASSLASRGVAALGIPFQKKDPSASLESLQAARAQTVKAASRASELEAAGTKTQKAEIAKKHAEEDAAASASKTKALNADLDNFQGTPAQYVQKQADLAAHEATAAEHKTALDSATRNEARVKGSYLNALGMNAVDAAKGAKRGVGSLGSTLAAPVTSLRKNADALGAFNAANGIVDMATSQFNAKYRQKTPEEEARLQAEEEEALKQSDAAERIDLLEGKMKTNIKDIGDIQRHLKNLMAKKAKAEAANAGLEEDKQTDLTPFQQQIDMAEGTLARAQRERLKLTTKLNEHSGGTRRRRPRGSTRKRARKRKQKKRPRRRATGRKRNSRQTAKGRTYFTADDHFF
jgi:hypothetical protein